MMVLYSSSRFHPVSQIVSELLQWGIGSHFANFDLISYKSFNYVRKKGARKKSKESLHLDLLFMVINKLNKNTSFFLSFSLSRVCVCVYLLSKTLEEIANVILVAKLSKTDHNQVSFEGWIRGQSNLVFKKTQRISSKLHYNYAEIVSSFYA